jgi:protein-histidine pros-kinase
METMRSARDYTTKQIKPLLQNQQEHLRGFLPQTVPAFAATEIFTVLRKNYPDYSYKEATLNPTNPRDRAVDWEADVIRVFRDRPAADKSLFDGERTTPAGRSVFLAAPLRATKSCMECHSTPDAAPAAMVKLYGMSNGFGWKEDEVIGAQIVSVPSSLPEAMAARTFRQLMIMLGIVGAVTLVVLNVVLVLTVIRPVRRFAAAADRISMGRMDVPELPVRGRDEISVLAGAFNRMHRSLAAAMRMLEVK